MHARRHEVIARALGRASRQHRRFDVDEARGVEILAHRHRHPIPQHHVFLHLRPAQIKHAMRKPRRLRQVVVIELKRNRYRSVQDRQLLAQHFDLARRERGVDGPFGALAHGASNLQAVFAAHFFCRREHIGPIGIADDLHQAFAISKVDKNDAAMVAPSMHPAK